MTKDTINIFSSYGSPSFYFLGINALTKFERGLK